MRILILMALAITLTALPGGAQAASSDAPMKVLGLHVEGEDLSPKERRDLFQVVQSRLKLHPEIALVQPPDTDILELMMDLQCLDIDGECLIKMAGGYDAERVIYAQVDTKGGKQILLVRVVDGAAGTVIHEERTKVADKVGLPAAIRDQITKVFGPPPAPKSKNGMLVVRTAVAGAQIFVDGEFAGTSKISLERPSGQYAIRVTKDGYDEQLFNLDVVAGETANRDVTLAASAVDSTVAPTPIADGDETEFYETWWFWTIVGVAAVGAVAGIVLGTQDSGEVGPNGPLTLSVGQGSAWRDITLGGSQ